MKDKDKKKKTDQLTNQSDEESLEKSDSVDDETSAVSEPTTPEESPETMPVSLVEEGKRLGFPASLKNNKLFLVGLVAAILVLTGGGIFLYRKKSAKIPSTPEVAQATPSPQTEAEVTPEEEPTPTIETLNREDLKLQVLNGSGVAGTASKAKEFLEGLGYKDVDAGNADSYNYEETEISIREDKKDYLELLTDDLSEKYTLAEETKTLDEESEFGVIVILGKE